jgi:hypothetical protein
MTSRTILLTLHVACVAAWLGADFLTFAIARRFDRDSNEVALGWARTEHWMHERYYALVAVLVLATGVGLVLDGDWSWSGWFIWVGVSAIVVGAAVGGGGLGALTKRRIAELESDDGTAAAATRRKMLPLQLVVTAAPILALLAMVDKWHA